METKALYNPNMEFEHQLWKEELAFWEDELNTFRNKLSELITRWTSEEVLAKFNYYQSEFVIHGAVIADLRDAIEIHENNIAEQSDRGDVSLNTILTKKHIEFRNKIEIQSESHAQLKKEFFRFLWDHI